MRDKVTGQAPDARRRAGRGHSRRSCSLLDVPVPTTPWDALDPPQRRQRTLERSSACCCARARCSRCCWSSRTCTGSIPRPRPCSTAWSRACRPPGSCCWSTTGPSTSTAGAARRYYTQLRLDPLPPGSAEALLQALLGDDPSLDAAQAAADRAHRGQSLLPGGERAHAGGDRGAGRRARGLSAWPSRSRHQVPATVQAVLAARIDRLPPRGEAAAPDRRRHRQGRAARPAAGHRRAAEEALHRGLAHLQAAEFLYETRLFPELEYTFKHALTHEVAYGSLLQERRRALTPGSSRPSRRSDAEPLAEQVERLAHHALRGEVWDKALTYCRQAGARASRARPTARRWRASSRRSRPSRICRRHRTPRGRPSICASTSAPP